MACCGGKRAQFHPRIARHPGAEPAQNVQRIRAIADEPVYFEYVGKTALTVQGTLTRTRYRFSGPGSRVAIDRREAPSFSAIPNLRRVR